MLGKALTPGLRPTLFHDNHIAIPLIARFLSRQLVRFGSIFSIATAPALLGLLLLVPFREPREATISIAIPGAALLALLLFFQLVLRPRNPLLLKS